MARVRFSRWVQCHKAENLINYTIMDKGQFDALMNYAKKFGYMNLPVVLVIGLWETNYEPKMKGGMI